MADECAATCSLLGSHHRHITMEGSTPNGYRTRELDAGELQRDVDWCNHHFKSMHVTPKFTKGQPYHPYHPKPYIHERIDATIRKQHKNPHQQQSIKVCVDCIDDTNFINHLMHAHWNGVNVRCIVDWRKMTLTNGDNYVRLKRSGMELLGVFCTPKDPSIEVAPDKHNKFIIFGDEDVMTGSFNITFDRWWVPRRCTKRYAIPSPRTTSANWKRSCLVWCGHRRHAGQGVAGGDRTLDVIPPAASGAGRLKADALRGSGARGPVRPTSLLARSRRPSANREPLRTSMYCRPRY